MSGSYTNDFTGDGLALWAQLYTGAGTRPTLESGACTAPAAEATPECGRATLEIQAPSKAEGSFEATVELDSTLAVEGWQLSVVAEGCRITAADLAGTVGAHQREGGRHSEGYARAEVVEGGALSVVVLNYLHEDSLGSGRRLRLEVEAEASGCAPCTLRLEDGRKGRGEALKNVLSAGCHSWFPKLPQARVQLCGG
jgi:hypothetical protein